MNLHENIHRIQSLMGEGKDTFVSRRGYDQEYEEQYPKWRKFMFWFFNREINSYSENDDTIVLFNDNDYDKYLMRYNKKNEHLWWDYSLKDDMSKLISNAYISRHFMYAVQDYFKVHFPDYGVREITGANIG